MLASKDQIKADRLRMNNPYAHLDEDGGFSALLPVYVDNGHQDPYLSLNSGDNSDEVWPQLPLTQSISSALVQVSAAQTPDLVASNFYQQGSQNPYAAYHNLDDDNGPVALPLPPILTFSQLTKAGSGAIKVAEIEALVEQLKQAIWQQKHLLWPQGIPSDPIEMLDPKVALYLLGYQVYERHTLGEIEPGIDVAGTIDKTSKRVELSRTMRPEVMNFTAAHEMGHAVMHQQSGLHRDKPLDGSNAGQRDQIEKEADKFAVLFLMPEKLVKRRFAERFPQELMQPEALAYLLNRSGDRKLAKTLSSQRGLSRALAELSSISGQHVLSLAEMFKVSREAMAIRLEELKLVPEIKF